MRRMVMVSLILVLLAVTTPSVIQAQTQCFPDHAPFCYEEPFARYWATNGGLPVFGYPMSAAANEVNADTGQTYLTQWAERNRFEYHPENAGTPYAILLGLLGKDRLRQLGRDPAAEPRESSSRAGCLWFEQTGHNVCNIDGNQGFKTFWESHGLAIPGLDPYARSLQLFGLPLTTPALETNANGDTVLTQWFERARFEWHPTNPDTFRVLLGLLGTEVRTGGPAPVPAPAPAWLNAVNHYRQLAGVPPVREDVTLNDNCWQHARYMAENQQITHNQDPTLPWASPAGQICAQNGNVYTGTGQSDALRPFHMWMFSYGHRLWMLYPTTPTFGYGYYEASNGTAGASLDVISTIRGADDRAYAGWPVRYPVAGQQGIPATIFPITLQWPRQGKEPVLTTTTWRTLQGDEVAHSASTRLPGGHKGIVLRPTANLRPNTTYTVQVIGSYAETAFAYDWTFTTGASGDFKH